MPSSYELELNEKIKDLLLALQVLQERVAALEKAIETKPHKPKPKPKKK